MSSNIEALEERIKETEQSLDYQMESVIVDLTEDICEIMQAQGLTKTELAAKLGRSKAWVTKLLRGDQNMTLKTVVSVLWALDHSVKVEAVPVDRGTRMGRKHAKHGVAA